MPFCPYCGSATVPEGRFCPGCGRRLPDSVSPESPDEGASVGYQTELATEPSVERLELPSASDAESASPFKPIPMPTPVNPSDLPGTHPEWRMSPPEPYVPSRQRPRWLLVVGAVLGACLLVCLALFILANLPPGQRWLSNMATQSALTATETPDTTPLAATPAP